MGGLAAGLTGAPHLGHCSQSLVPATRGQRLSAVPLRTTFEPWQLGLASHAQATASSLSQCGTQRGSGHAQVNKAATLQCGAQRGSHAQAATSAAQVGEAAIAPAALQSGVVAHALAAAHGNCPAHGPAPDGTQRLASSTPARSTGAAGLLHIDRHGPGESGAGKRPELPAAGVQTEHATAGPRSEHASAGQFSEVALLDAAVREMRALVSAQQATIGQLQALVADQARLTVNGMGVSLNGSSNGVVRPYDAQRAAIGDRRYLGMYDARFHSTHWGATPQDYRVLPKKIFLVRHAESEGNVDNFAYTFTPDPQVPLTQRGHRQAEAAGNKIKAALEADGEPYKLYFYMSPYMRSKQTVEALSGVFREEDIAGFQEEVQLREQDFGNFQDAEGKQKEKAERLRFGRFFYRFPNGESGADVYDRMTIFEDHLIRDINAGRYAGGTSLVLVTHGLALRVLLMRWFHWSVDQFMNVFNPPNAEPLELELMPDKLAAAPGGSASWIHTKALYRLAPASREFVRGCSDEMCSTSVLASGVNLWGSHDAP